MVTASFGAMTTAYVGFLMGWPRVLFPLPATDVYRLHSLLPLMPASYTFLIAPVIHTMLLGLVVCQWISRRGARTILNETVRRNGLILSLSMLTNIVWMYLFCRNSQLYSCLAMMAQAVMLSTCATDIHAILPQPLARGAGKLVTKGKMWLNRAKDELTRWDVILTQGTVSMYTAFSWWVAILQGALFLESRYSFLMGLFRHPVASSALILLAVVQTWSNIQTGEVFSTFTSLWMLIGVLVSSASKKEVPTIVASSVGMNFIVIFGLVMAALGLGLHRMPFITSMLGMKSKRRASQPATNVPTQPTVAAR